MKNPLLSTVSLFLSCILQTQALQAAPSQHVLHSNTKQTVSGSQLVQAIGNYTFDDNPIKRNEVASDLYVGQLLALPDVNGDGVSELGLLQVDVDLSQVRLRILDAKEKESLHEVVWVDNFSDETLTLHVIPDMNDNGFDEVGLFGIQDVEGNEGKPQMFVRDLKTGNRVSVYNWVANWTEVSALVLDDMSGDGLAEIAIQGRFKEGSRPQLIVKTGNSNNIRATYSYPDLFMSPQFYQHSDTDGDGFAEIATFGRLIKNNKIQAKIASGIDAGTKRKAYNFPDNWDNVSWHRLDDSNGDGQDDWGMFGTLRADGRPQLVNKDGVSPLGALRIFAWPSQMQNAQFFRIPDMNNDGVDEVAAAGRRSNNGRYQFQIQDGTDRNVLLANHNLNLNLENVSYHVLPDLSGDEQVEIGFLGITPDGDWELVVQHGDTANGNYDSYLLGSDWQLAPTIVSLGDLNNDDSPDLLFFGYDASGEDLEIFFVDLDMPTRFNATSGDEEVSLDWRAVTGATSYNLYVSEQSFGSPVDTAGALVTNITSTTHVVSGLTNGTSYYFVVVAVGANGEGLPSIEIAETPTARVVPDIPTGFTATSGDAEVSLSWSTVAGATSYNLYVSEQSFGSPVDTAGALVTNITSTTHVVSGLTNGTSYYFVVVAVGANGEGLPSIEIVEAPTAPDVPEPPNGFTATSGDAEVSLSWSTVAEATSYNLYVSELSFGSPVDTTGALVTNITNASHVVSGLTNGNSYYFVVMAVGANGEGLPSIQIVETPKAPDVPQLPYGSLTITNNNQAESIWAPTDGFGALSGSSLIGQWNGEGFTFMQIALTVNSNSEASGTIVFRLDILSASLLCVDEDGNSSSAVCTDITIDTVAKTVTFLNVQMAEPTISGTGNIYTLNGTLRY